MATPKWPGFAIAVAALVAVLLALSRLSARTALPREPPSPSNTAPQGDPADAPEPTPPGFRGVGLLANVAVTHGLLALGVLGALWVARVPASAVGIGPLGPQAVATGGGLGIGLYLASESASTIARRFGVDPDERLRRLLAPTRPAEWVVLLGGVLPIIAVAEEFLFRGALVGALAVGFGLPAAGLIVAAGLLFGVGHSAQGELGVAVTAALGMVLGAAFVLTGSLAVVVIAHYLVDALEFGVREGLLDRRSVSRPR